MNYHFKPILYISFILMLFNISFAMYDTHTGRFMQQDPLGIQPAADEKTNPFKSPKQYSDGMNIYEHVKSNPVTSSDPLGLAISEPGDGGEGFGGCSTESCIESCKKRGGTTQDCEDKCLDVWLKFTEWYYGEHPDFSNLPACPCKLSKCYPNRRESWFEVPEDFRFVSPVWYRFYLQKYHPGASYDLRSTESPSQQCTYDDNGKLITHGIGAGTADACNNSNQKGHREKDVNAADWAMFLDGNPDRWPSDDGPCFRKYIEKRPVNEGKDEKGNPCPRNP